MTIICFVEGIVDTKVLQEVAKRCDLKFEIEPRGEQGVDYIKKNIGPVLRTTQGIVIIATDYDGETADQIYNQYKNILSDDGFTISNTENGVITVEDNKVCILPLGLPNDRYLQGLNIDKHMIEDYILKLLATDDDLIKSISKEKIVNIDGLNCFINDIMSTLNKHDLSFNNSKFLVEIIKSLFDNTSSQFFAKNVISKSTTSHFDNTLKNVITFYYLIKNLLNST